MRPLFEPSNVILRIINTTITITICEDDVVIVLEHYHGMWGIYVGATDATAPHSSSDGGPCRMLQPGPLTIACSLHAS